MIITTTTRDLIGHSIKTVISSRMAWFRFKERYSWCSLLIVRIYNRKEYPPTAVLRCWSPSVSTMNYFKVIPKFLVQIDKIFAGDNYTGHGYQFHNSHVRCWFPIQTLSSSPQSSGFLAWNFKQCIRTQKAAYAAKSLFTEAFNPKVKFV